MIFLGVDKKSAPVAMGYDIRTGTENSFTFIPTAEVVHGRKTITGMNVPQGGVNKDNLVHHKINWMKHQVYYDPTRTPGLASSIRQVDLGSTTPAQTERLRGVYGVAMIPYATSLHHGH